MTQMPLPPVTGDFVAAEEPRRFLSPADLAPGDIILHCPGAQRWYERGIAFCTGSRFTHASIYLGDEMIAEARYPKVRVCAVTRPMRRERELCILRQNRGLSARQVTLLHQFVEAALAREARFDFWFPFVFYSSRFSRHLWPRLRSAEALGPLPPANRSKYFCTSFVIDAYRAMGLIDKSEGRIYQLSSLSAADLLQNDKFGAVVGHLRTEHASLRVAP